MITTQALQNALKTRRSRVKLTRHWQETHDEMGVGQMAGDQYLYLSGDDYDRLQDEYDRRTRHAPLSLDLSQDRVAVARYAENEKTSTRQVFSGFLRVGASHGRIFTTAAHQDICLLPNSYLSLKDPDMLDLSRYQRVLIVENGAMMENLEGMEAILPSEYREATLYVYRGHDSSARRVSELVSALTSTHRLGLFCDYDMAGLDIAAQYLKQRPSCPVEMLAPEAPDALTIQGRESLYIIQMEMMGRVMNHTGSLPSLTRHIDTIRKARKGLTQEAMLAHRIYLCSEKISR
ncbi:hypothetical protein KG088_17145 [Halomonas sp. TRM85114]|uniref:DUF7281 domain-containing protein n=1 Tax=Halomonas jincaotanensis TaxID=2810616 RepID=UPI001BD646C2|nr:hypothetical protein [Halomonas jincaotanensis]MBS9405341.1 hypothetical protein [Halomonas jincaotanensis]